MKIPKSIEGLRQPISSINYGANARTRVHGVLIDGLEDCVLRNVLVMAINSGAYLDFVCSGDKHSRNLAKNDLINNWMFGDSVVNGLLAFGDFIHGNASGSAVKEAFNSTVSTGTGPTSKNSGVSWKIPTTLFLIIVLLLGILVIQSQTYESESALLRERIKELMAPAPLSPVDSLNVKEVITSLYQASTNQDVPRILELYEYPIRKWYNYLELEKSELESEAKDYFETHVIWEKNKLDSKSLRIKVVGKEYYSSYQLVYEVYQKNRIYHRYRINLRVILNENLKILEITELSRKLEFKQYYPNYSYKTKTLHMESLGFLLTL